MSEGGCGTVYVAGRSGNLNLNLAWICQNLVIRLYSSLDSGGKWNQVIQTFGLAASWVTSLPAGD